MSSGGGKFQFFQFESATGIPYVSCKLYHYAAGTTTDKDIWTDEAKTTAAAQPIVGDSRGIVTFYADGDYKFVLKDSADNTLYTWDNVRITSDSATMWENNHGTAYPTAAAANIWQLFAKHTAGNVLQEVGINNGTAFVPLVSIDSNLRYAADTGAADAYVIAPSPPITAYTAGQEFSMKATNANTGASTINVNSLGIKSIKRDGSTALTAGDILAGEIIKLQYDGANFQLLNAGNIGNATGNVPISNGTLCTNLNADMIDGLQSTVFWRDSSIDSTVQNAGVVTILSTDTTISTIDLGSVATSEHIFVQAYVYLTKGGTIGSSYVKIVQDSGTATISTITNLRQQIYHTNGQGWGAYIFGRIRVTGAGTLILKLVGASAGSDSSVAINDSYFNVFTVQGNQ